MEHCSYHRLAELIDDADRAYQQARAEVFDRLTLSARLDPDRMSRRHRDVLDRLAAAEAAVADYRCALHAEAAGSGQRALATAGRCASG